MVEGIPFRIHKAALQFVAEASVHAARRSELNAPILTGMLRAGCYPIETKVRGDDFIGGVADDVPYAAYVHAMVAPEGPKGLGPVSRQQPKQPEGGPMGGYIENTVLWWVPTYDRALREMVDKAIKGRDVAGSPLLSLGG